MKQIVIVFLAVLLLGSCSIIDNKSEDLTQSDFYNPLITKNIYFERLSDTQQGIYISQDNSNELSNRKYIVKDVLIFRYAYNADYLAYHWNRLLPVNGPSENIRTLNSMDYEIIKDCFTVFDVSNNKHYNYETQDEFLEFCETKNITVDWIYSNGFTYETVAQIHGDVNWDVLKADSESLMGFILKNNEVIYEGYISDVYCDSENILAFKLEVPSKNVLEYRNLKYENLSISFDEVKKKRRELVFLTENLYYSKYVVINVKDGSITEYDNWYDFSKAIRIH